MGSAEKIRGWGYKPGSVAASRGWKEQGHAFPTGTSREESALPGPGPQPGETQV